VEGVGEGWEEEEAADKVGGARNLKVDTVCRMPDRSGQAETAGTK